MIILYKKIKVVSELLKRKVVFIVSILMALGMSACSGETNNTDATSDSHNLRTPSVLTILNSDCGNSKKTLFF